MSLIDRVRQDRLTARKARDAGRVTALGGLLAALQDADKDTRDGLDEQAEIAVLRRERKRRDEAAESFASAGRDADAARERAEAVLIDRYLPEALTADQLGVIIDAAIGETNATSARDLGAVMKLVVGRVAGRADGKTVATAVRARLGDRPGAD